MSMNYMFFSSFHVNSPKAKYTVMHTASHFVLNWSLHDQSKMYLFAWNQKLSKMYMPICQVFH